MNSRDRSEASLPFHDYLPIEEIVPGLTDESLLQGCLRVTPSNRKVAYVTCVGLSIDVRVDDVMRNRSIHGDIVILKLLPQSEWLSVAKKTHREVSYIVGSNPDGSDNKERDHHLAIQHDLWGSQEPLLGRGESSNPDNVVHDTNNFAKRITKICHDDGLQPTAKVVHILKKSREKLHVGILSARCKLVKGQSLPASEKFVTFKPTNNTYPHMIISRSCLPPAYLADPFSQERHLHQAEIVDVWPVISRLPFGSNVRSIGEMGCIHVETEAILISNGVNYEDFTDEMLLSLSFNDKGDGEKINWTIPESEILKRRDLRGYRIFTIDPYNAKDLDDALHITPLNDGTYEIGVHIADVSYFLKEGTLLDEEAKKRATSIYLVQKVIPMLPAILCEQLCSLNPNVDRLAYSCIWRMKADGSVIDEKPYFGRTVIRSCAKLDYATAQRMIDKIIPSHPSDGDNPDAFLTSLSHDIWESNRRPIGQSAWECSRDVCLMNSVARNRRVTRLSNGALVMQQPKLSFRLDSVGNPSSVSVYPILESNSLVEEYMLLANYNVAKELLSRNMRSAFLRNHRPPSPDNLIKIQKKAASCGMSLDVSSSGTINEGLLKLRSTCSAALNGAVSSLLLSTMNQAKYIVAGNTTEWNHYALAIPYYTHFTSPIRRYADVIVHRLLEIGLEEENAAVTEIQKNELPEKYGQIADHSNEMRIKAIEIQAASDNIFFAAYLKNNSIYADAVVVGTGPSSFSVYVMSLGHVVRLFTDEMHLISPLFNKVTEMLILQLDPNKNTNNRKAECFQNPNILKFDRIELSVATPVVLYISAIPDGPLSNRYSLVCAGTCLQNGFQNATFGSKNPFLSSAVHRTTGPSSASISDPLSSSLDKLKVSD